MMRPMFSIFFFLVMVNCRISMPTSIFVVRKKNIENIGRIMRALKPPNVLFSLWTPSPPEASNYELCQKPVVVLTYNTIKGFKMKQDMRYAGYSETESKYCTLQKRVQKANKKFLEEVQYQTIVLPSFVDTKYNLRLKC